MGGSSGSQQQQSSSTSSPWLPSQPLLQNILGSITSGYNPTPTPTQNAALGQIQQNSQNLPNLSPQVAGLSSQLLSGTPNLNQGLTGALNTSQGALAPFMNPNYLDPRNNPYTSGALNTLNQDITNQIGSQFAGAGQPMSPAEAQALARGLGQGESGVLMGQFNTNAGQIQSAAQQYMQNQGQANQGFLSNANAGVQNLPNIASAANLGPLSSLAASNMAYNLPLSQIGGVEGLTLPIAGLGGQTQSQGTSNMQYNASPFSMIQGAGNMFYGGPNSAFSGITGAGSGILGGLSNLLPF